MEVEIGGLSVSGLQRNRKLATKNSKRKRVHAGIAMKNPTHRLRANLLATQPPSDVVTQIARTLFYARAT